MLRQFFQEIYYHPLKIMVPAGDGQYEAKSPKVNFRGTDISRLEPHEIAYLIYEILPRKKNC